MKKSGKRAASKLVRNRVNAAQGRITSGANTSSVALSSQTPTLPSAFAPPSPPPTQPVNELIPAVEVAESIEPPTSASKRKRASQAEKGCVVYTYQLFNYCITQRNHERHKRVKDNTAAGWQVGWSSSQTTPTKVTSKKATKVQPTITITETEDNFEDEIGRELDTVRRTSTQRNSVNRANTVRCRSYDCYCHSNHPCQLVSVQPPLTVSPDMLDRLPHAPSMRTKPKKEHLPPFAIANWTKIYCPEVEAMFAALPDPWLQGTKDMLLNGVRKAIHVVWPNANYAVTKQSVIFLLVSFHI
jgi:hypothetical protein